MTSYGTELGGLLAVLYLTYQVCPHYDIQTGKLHYYCDDKAMPQKIFHSQIKPDITFLWSLTPN